MEIILPFIVELITCNMKNVLVMIFKKYLSLNKINEYLAFKVKHLFLSNNLAPD